ncbi:glycosyltransferase [Leptolyngbya sp. Cla-17]|uniref:glycosyltransferase n=1 Tax=Leptolyngbya sp. Cla-17 TaxID=2803751 RepID=UPI0018D658CF|nr:glycosyltransferase [Leptolyngbya sp. Cla-17]
MFTAISNTDIEPKPGLGLTDFNSRIIVFDLSVLGHHASYIKHLLRYWIDLQAPGELIFIVSPKFLQAHSDVVQLASESHVEGIQFIAITEEEEETLNSRKTKFDRAFRNLREWNLLQKYAESIAATHCLLMYLDTCELPLLIGAKLPCSFSGIYFRPTFHYSDLSQFVPSWKERMQQVREKLFITRTLHHPKLQTLFCLDPFAVECLNSGSKKAIAVSLPDPVEPIVISNSELENFRSQLNIQPDRQVFLLFGSFEAERKGIYQLLDALALLPASVCQKICILLVGNANVEEQARIQVRIDHLCQHQPVQIETRFEFIPDPDVEKYFLVTDVALAIYQRHVGMSGILLLAAAAQKPVLSSNYGLMGELVKRHHLGLTVDSTAPEEIATGLTQFLSESSQSFSDRTEMKTFVEKNSARLFAQTIFEHILK